MSTISELESKINTLEQDIEAKQEEIANVEYEMDHFDKSEYAEEEDYKNMLDEVYGDVEVAGSYYSTSRILEELDPTAYHSGFTDYVDSLDFDEFSEYVEMEEHKEELESDLENLEEELENLNEELYEAQEEEES